MCLLALLFRMVEDAPLIVGANREEFYDRGGAAPTVWSGPVRAVGGMDPKAGGSWLGVNEQGVVVAVTNRPKTQLPQEPRSRGLLVRDLLVCSTASAAAARGAQALGGNTYAGCNLVCADADSVVVLHAGDWLRVRPLTPGVHVLTSHDVNDASDARLGHAHWWLSQHDHRGASEWLAALRELCGQAGDGSPPICMRGEQGGTVSSSLLAIRQPLAQSTYLHAQGPPDRTPFVDLSHLFQELTTNPAT
jgi:uncharacterized protein with NRDE domain